MKILYLNRLLIMVLAWPIAFPKVCYNFPLWKGNIILSTASQTECPRNTWTPGFECWVVVKPDWICVFVASNKWQLNKTMPITTKQILFLYCSLPPDGTGKGRAWILGSCILTLLEGWYIYRNNHFLCSFHPHIETGYLSHIHCSAFCLCWIHSQEMFQKFSCASDYVHPNLI